MGDDNDFGELVGRVPSHGRGTLVPFDGERAKEMSKRAVARKAAIKAEKEAEAASSAEQRIAKAAATRELVKTLRAMGVTEARDLLKQSKGDEVATLARAIAYETLARIMAGEFRIGSASEAIRVAEGTLKLARLEEGRTTEIVESDFEAEERLKDALRRVRKSA